MNLILTLAIFSGLALADKYSPGAICNDSVECNSNCLDKRYTIGSKDGSAVFVCNPTIADTNRYFKAVCQVLLAVRVSIDDYPKTATACNTIGGESCSIGCVITGRKTTTDTTTSAWKQACVDAGATDGRISDTEPDLTKESARSRAGCVI